MNTNRFRVVTRTEDYGDYGTIKTIHLEIRLPYKNCFGKSKVYYKSVFYTDLDRISSLKLCTKEETLKYLIELYQEKRLITKYKRNLKRNFNI